MLSVDDGAVIECFDDRSGQQVLRSATTKERLHLQMEVNDKRNFKWKVKINWKST